MLVNLTKPMRFMSEVDSRMQSVSGIFLMYFFPYFVTFHTYQLHFQTLNALEVIFSQRKQQPCTEM